MHNTRRVFPGILAVAALSLAPMTATADPFNYIRIGDLDGFGFTSTAGLVRATPSPHTTPADTNGNNRLQVLEFLPDLNKNGVVDSSSGLDDIYDWPGTSGQDECVLWNVPVGAPRRRLWSLLQRATGTS